MPHKPRISTRIDDRSLMELRELSRLLRLSSSATVRAILRMGINSMTDDRGYLKADIAERLHVTPTRLRGKKKRGRKSDHRNRPAQRKTKRGWDMHLQLRITFEMEYHQTKGNGVNLNDNPTSGTRIPPPIKFLHKSCKKTYPEISARCGRLYSELRSVCNDEDVMQDTIIYISADVEALSKDSDNDFLTHFLYRYEMMKYRDKKNKQQEAKQNANY